MHAAKAASDLRSPLSTAELTASRIALTSSGANLISAPLAFSSTRPTDRQPGIGTTGNRGKL